MRLLRPAHISPYGSYRVLNPSTAMTVYPDIRPVPPTIPRPVYVPSNFFNVGWGYHVSPPEIRTPSQEEGRLDVKGMEGVRAVGRMAAEILRKAGELIKVSVSGGL